MEGEERDAGAVPCLIGALNSFEVFDLLDGVLIQDE